MNESQKLLAEYSVKGSEAAFRELVARYIDLVYSTALRIVEGDAHRAEDVTQQVFIDLARQASKLSSNSMLGGWLHRDTCFVAAKLMRGERRRQLRERQAAEMNALTGNDTNLDQIAPVLDEAINGLADVDRQAILLRFYERMDLRSVGEALGSSENAAQKRVSRALDELRSALGRRGVALSAAALGTALAAEAVSAAPAGLAAAISGPALAAGSGTTLTVLKLMATTKLKLGILGALVVAGVATPVVLQHQTQAKLQLANTALSDEAQRISQLEAENQRLSNTLAQANAASTRPAGPSNELLRLRSEVGQLRQGSNDLARTRLENQELAAQLAQMESNHVSPNDQSILQRQHAQMAVFAILGSMLNYATNHDGQYPTDWSQLTGGNPITTNLPGNFALDDFELTPGAGVNLRGGTNLFQLRVPLQQPERGSVTIVGGVNSNGIPFASMRNVAPGK